MNLRHARRRASATLFVCLAAVAAAPATSHALERPAEPATFADVFATADAGETILLSSGDYGTFTGAMKRGEVTLRAQPGATATIAVDFDPAANITLDGLRIRTIHISGARTRNIRVRNSRIVGQTILRTGELANANILFDHNVHDAWDVCNGCAEGRVWLPARTEEPSGITISNSRFGPGGNSDGIQNGSNATRIINNEFVGIRQVDGAEGVHADSIQLYGSKNTFIAGNYFHQVSVGIMCADGCDHERIEDNVFDVDGSPYAVQLLSDDGSIIRHNTFTGHRICDYDQRCGVLYLGNKSQDPASRGTIVEDNILTRICVCDGTRSGLASEDYNLLRSGGKGTHDLRGIPTYTGGNSVTTLNGFTLATSSLGKTNASDGRDRGARIAAAQSATPSPDVDYARVLSSLRSIARTGRLRVAARSNTQGPLMITASVRPGRAIASFRGRHPRSAIRLTRAVSRRRDAGRHVVVLRVGPRARRILRRARDAKLSTRINVGTRTSLVTRLEIRR